MQRLYNAHQRFGGSLNLNVHFHALIFDGVYSPSGPQAKPRFHALPPPVPEDIAKLVTAIRSRILRQLRKRGISSKESAEEENLFGSCYAARPAIANGRLSETPDGRILYKVKTPYADGTSFLLFDPLTFLEKLAALIPPPRVNLTLYHGMLAPNARLRNEIVPQPPMPRSPEGPIVASATKPRNFLWAELMRRTFDVDVLTCPWCAGPRKLIALIQKPEAIRKILEHLGLPSQPPGISPPRPPPARHEDAFSYEQS